MSASPLNRRLLLIATALIAALFVGVEITLGVVGPQPGLAAGGLTVGHQPDVAYITHADEHGGWVRNRQELTPYLFLPDDKPEGTLRVATLGASSMKAPPPDGASWLLAALLEQGSGGRSQFVTAGARGYGATRIAGLQRELLERQLDGVVLYTGHCEFSEQQLTASGDLSAGLIPWLATHSRLVGLIIAAPGEEPSLPPPDLPPQRAHVSVDPVDRDALEARFRAALDSIARDARDAGVVSVWVLPASNLLRPPAGSDGDEADELDRDAEARVQALERGDPDAVQGLDALIEQHPEHAALRYVHGRLMLARGQYDAAFSSLVLARDLDAYPARASSALRGAMAEVAAEHGVAVVDAEALLLAEDRERYLGGGFGEHTELLGREAYRIVMEQVYAELAAQLPGLTPMDELRVALPPRGTALPALLDNPIQRGPQLEVDFTKPGDGNRGAVPPQR